MMALSCFVDRRQYFFNSEKNRPQSHICYSFKDNVKKDDPEVIASVLALVTNLFCDYGHTNVTDIVIYDAPNKNISRIKKTSEFETYKKYFPLCEAITKLDHNIFNDIFYYEWNGYQGMKEIIGIKLFTDSTKIIKLYNECHLDEIKKAISHFNKDYAKRAYVINDYVMAPVNDKLLIQLKLALSSELYENMNVISIDF